MKPSERIKEIFDFECKTQAPRSVGEISKVGYEAIIQYLDEKLHSAPLLVTEQVGLESTGRLGEIRERIRKVLG